MGRSSALSVQTPGAPAPAEASAPGVDALGTDDSDEAAAAQGAEIPKATPDDTNDELAALRRRVAALEAENAGLAAKAETASQASAIFDANPTTPHGIIRMAESETSHMTVKQVMAAIDAGKLSEPNPSYLCADGYYVRRG